MRYTGALLLLATTMVLLQSACAPQETDLQHVTVTEGTNISIAVDREERFIIHDLQGALYRMDISGGDAELITSLYMDARQPSISEDGSTIYFQSYADGNWHIYSISLEGTDLKQLTSGQYDHREPASGPSEGLLAYASDKSGSYDIWMVSPGSEGAVQLTTSDYHDYGPSFSKDGSQLSFIRETPDGWQLHVMDLHKHATTSVYQSEHKLYAPSWSYSDSTITFIEHDWLQSTIKEISLHTSAIASVTEASEDVFPFRVQHTNGGQYYTADGQIKVMNTNPNASSATIPFKVELPINTQKYQRKKPQLIVEKSQKVKGIHGPKISPDGTKICFISLCDVWIKDLTNDSLIRVTHDGFIQLMPSWHPNGASIIYASDKGNHTALWAFDLSQEAHRKIGLINAMPSGISVHPDGHSIAYTMAFGPRSGQLSIMNLETGSSTSPRSNFPFSPSSPSWHPDGQRILLSILQPYSGLYREGIARNIIVDISSGATTSQRAPAHLSFGARTNDPPLIIDGGQKLLYISQGQLHEAGLDDDLHVIGNTRTIISSLVDAPSISEDHQLISYLSGDRLMLFDRAHLTTSHVDIDLSYQPSSHTPQTVIRAGTIITMDGERLRDHDIVIQDHKITSIVPLQAWDDDIALIDASNQYVIPGLIDMHAHQGSDLGTSLGYKWLSWGVTSTRDPATYPYDAQNRKEAQINGDILHPRIFYTGSPIDGNRVYYNGTYAQMSLEQIERELTRSQDLSFDLIKTYVRLPDGLQQAVIDFAHTHGLPVTSHELYPAALMGIDGVEHILGTSRRGYTPKMSLTYKNYKDVARIITAADMTFTPTIGIYSGYNYMLHQHPELIEDRRLRLLESAYTLAGASAGIATVEEDPQDYRRMFERQASLIKNIQEQGGHIIAGTDSPILPYGFGFFIELLCYQEAGLDPYTVLQTATNHAAQALHTADQIGSIKEGMLADMIILDKDPTKNIYNLKYIDKVILSGRVHSLDDILDTYTSYEH